VTVSVSYPPELNINDMLKRLKGRNTKLLPEEYLELKKGIGEVFCGIQVMKFVVQGT
jgi:hypothetical protein